LNNPLPPRVQSRELNIIAMKKFLIPAAAALAGLLAGTEPANAGGLNVSFTCRSGRAPCGCAVHVRRVFRGYDCYRRPVYHYHRLPVRHVCRARPARPARYYYNYSSYCRPRPACRGRVFRHRFFGRSPRRCR